MLREFRLHWKAYVSQSLLAALTIFVVLLVLSLQHVVIIASIGATAFMVSAMPKNITAQPGNVIGGHPVGLVSGSLRGLVPHPSSWYSIPVYCLAVGLSIFVMVVTDTEHLPASGTALGAAVTGVFLNATLAVVMSVIILSLAHDFLRPFLRDLT